MLTNSWNINFYFIFGDLTAFNNKYFCLYIFFGIFALLNIFINKCKKIIYNIEYGIYDRTKHKYN